MKKLLTIFLVISILITTSVAVFAKNTDGSAQLTKIKVGINAQFPPFEYYDGEFSDASVEQYGIVFPDSSVEKW